MSIVCFVFFFCKQKTAYEMRISDWSSDVCSSDLLDVRDPVALADWLAAVDRDHPLDLVIANAGISAGTGTFGETDRQARDILAVNLDGVVTTVLEIGRAHV